MEKEKIYKILDMIIRDEFITTLTIYEYGITSNEFVELLKKHIVEEIGDNKYKINNYDLLFEYGVSLINKREFDRGIIYLLECYKNNKDSLDIKLNLLLGYIYVKKIDGIEMLLDIIKNDIKEEDFNLIIYLLSVVMLCPDKYIETVLNMRYENLNLSDVDCQYNNVDVQNTLRAYVIQNKFYYAKKTYYTKLTKDFSNKVFSKIIEVLLLDAYQLEDKRNKLIINCVGLRDFNTIYNILEKKKKKMKLNLTDRLIYLITKDIVMINKVNKIPKPMISNTNKLEDAVVGKNYYLALKIITEQVNVISDKDLKKSITILLVEINKLIRKVYEEYIQNKNNDDTKTKKREL